MIITSVADAGLVLTVNGLDTSMPIDVKTEKRYANPEILSDYIEIQLSARKAYGMDKYIEHLEKRLKRLEEHLNK